MLPYLLRLDSLGIRIYTYGVLLAAAYITGIWVAGKLSGLSEPKGMPEKITHRTGMFVVVGGVCGAWLFQVLVEMFGYGRGLNEAISSSMLQGGAGVFLGGIVGGASSTIIYARYHKAYWWHNADAPFAAIPLGQAIGRLGCFAAGCCWGQECHLPWAVTFPPEGHQLTGVPTGVPLHPTQLYSVLGNLVLFGLLVWLLRRKTFGGQVVLAYFIGYGVLRFILEMFRDDPRGFLPFGLSTSQFLSLIFVGAALALWPLLKRWGLPDSPQRPDARKKWR